MNSIINSRIWRVIEPIILLVVFGLLAREIVPYWGVTPNMAAAALAESPPDWGVLALVDGKSQSVKWGLLVGAAIMLAALRRYNVFRPVGGAPTLPLPQLILFGLAVAIPLGLMVMLPRWYHYEVAPLGEARAIWDLIYTSPWTLEFWLFMAISSFLLIPIVEEVFFRGYFLGSLQQVFSPFWTITISAAIFAIVHLQYAKLDPFALYSMLMVFIASAAFAWTVLATRSVVPAIVAHAYGNFPQPLSWTPYEIVLIIPAGIIIFVLLRRMRRSGPT